MHLLDSRFKSIWLISTNFYWGYAEFIALLGEVLTLQFCLLYIKKKKNRVFSEQEFCPLNVLQFSSNLLLHLIMAWRWAILVIRLIGWMEGPFSSDILSALHISYCIHHTYLRNLPLYEKYLANIIIGLFKIKSTKKATFWLINQSINHWNDFHSNYFICVCVKSGY